MSSTARDLKDVMERPAIDEYQRCIAAGMAPNEALSIVLTTHLAMLDVMIKVAQREHKATFDRLEFDNLFQRVVMGARYGKAVQQ